MEGAPKQEWPSQESVEQFAGELRLELAKINFGTMQDIFRDYAVRSGVDPETIDFQTGEKIKILTQSKTRLLGQYTTTDGVQFNVPAMVRYDEECGNALENIRRVLFHEETHASGHNHESCAGEDMKSIMRRHSATGETIEVDTSGYRQNVVEGELLHYFFRILNEGVTDLIAEEAYREYHHRTGESDVAPFMRGYEGLPHRIVALLVQKLSERTGVERDAVWEGFVQGYFTGQNLRDDEMRTLFEETLGMDVVKLIEEIKNKEQAEEVIKEIERIAALGGDGALHKELI